MSARKTKRKSRRATARAEARESYETQADRRRHHRLEKARTRTTHAEKAAAILASHGKDPGKGPDPDGPLSEAGQRRVDLFRVVKERAPKIANPLGDQIGALTSQDWVRDLDTWKPRGKGVASLFRSLAEHLFCRYPVPAFLYSAFTPPGNVALFAHLAGGGSLVKVAGSTMMPPKLTKKMCHEFMQTKGILGIVPAVRQAQVRCLGGDRRLARLVIDTQIGRHFYHVGGEEDFWATVIQWLCAQGMVEPGQIGPIIDFVRNQREQDRGYSIKGRTARSVIRQMQVWHRELRQTQAWGGWKPTSETFPASGIKGGRWKTQKNLRKGGAPIITIWEFTEIRTVKDLHQEGYQMRHCVYSYGPRIEAGRTAIFHMSRDGQKSATVEVERASKAVVQARGPCNRKLDSDEERALLAWAASQSLTVKLGYW